MKKTAVRPYGFEDMVAAIKASLLFAYSVRRKNKKRDIPYDGPIVTNTQQLAGCPGIAEQLTAENIEYGEENQARDALDVIIGCALQLGIEQGFRIVSANTMVRIYLREIKSSLDEPGDIELRTDALDSLVQLEDHLRAPGGVGWRKHSED